MKSEATSVPSTRLSHLSSSTDVAPMVAPRAPHAWPHAAARAPPGRPAPRVPGGRRSAAAGADLSHTQISVSHNFFSKSCLHASESSRGQ